MTPSRILDLEGLIPATVLPMHADGSIDEAGLRRTSAGWSTRARSRWRSTSTPARDRT